MDTTSVTHCEVQVTRPALTVHRRSDLYNYCPEQQGGLRERLCERTRKYGRCSRGRVWKTITTHLPILDWLPKYQLRQALLGDIIAGITIGVMTVPQAMAYALLAGLPPITGLYASVISGLLYVCLGTSHHLSFGVVASLSVLTNKAVGNLATNEILPVSNTTISPTTLTPDQGLENFTDLSPLPHTTAIGSYSSVEVAVALALLVGMCQVLMGVFQLGQMFSLLLSEMVTSGFTTSVAFDILPSQIKDLLGISVPRYSGPFKSFYTYRELCLALSTMNPTVLFLSVSTMVLLVANIGMVKPRLKKVCSVPVPMELLVVMVGTLASYLLNLEEGYQVTVIGHVPKGFPIPSVPPVELIPRLLFNGIVIAVVGYACSISMAKIIAKRQGYIIHATQELYAQGIMNLAGSFFSCPPIGVALSRSVIQEEVGGVSQLASLFSTVVLIVTLYYIGPLFSALPSCVLASVVLVSFRGVFYQVKDLAKLWSSSRLDAAVWVVTFVVSIVVDLDYGLLAGVLASGVVLLLRAQRPSALHLGHVPFTDIYLDLDRYHKAVEVPGVKIFQFGGPLHFGNASYFYSSLFSVTGLDLAALGAAKGYSIPKHFKISTALTAVTLNSDLLVLPSILYNNPKSDVSWCISHTYTSPDYGSFLYDLKRRGTPESDAIQASTSHGDVSQDDTRHGDVIQDDTRHGDVSQDDTSHGDVSQDDTSHGDVSQDDTRHCDVSQDDTRHGDVSQDDTRHCDVSQDDTSHGDVSQDDTRHCDVSQDDTRHGDVSQDDTRHCDVSQDDTSHGDVSQDDTSHGDVSNDETSYGDVSQSDTIRIGVSQDDMSHSDAKHDTNSDDCNHGDPSQGSADQDNNTNQSAVNQVSKQDAANDSSSTQKPRHLTIVSMDDEAAKESTCFTLPVPRWLVLDLSLVSFVDTTGAHLLTQLHRDLQPVGVTLCLTSASDRVLNILEKCGVLEEISHDVTFHSIHDAVTAITCQSPAAFPDL